MNAKKAAISIVALGAVALRAEDYVNVHNAWCHPDWSRDLHPDWMMTYNADEGVFDEAIPWPWGKEYIHEQGWYEPGGAWVTLAHYDNDVTWLSGMSWYEPA